MRVLFTLGALFGALAVIFGAFGAHKLKELLTPDQLSSYDTAVKYQFYHVFAILTSGLLWLKWPQSGFITSGWLFVVGILFFSGSIYLLSCKDLFNLGNFTKVLGPITPIGGVIFIVGWVWMAVTVYKSF